jgi:hypothetical protein
LGGWHGYFIIEKSVSCCGGKVVEKGIAIATGYGRLATDTIGLTEPYEWADSRIAVCRTCEQGTWMTMGEYAVWLKANGVEVVKHFTELEKLPPLPKYELDGKRRNLFCMLCKCYTPAKSRVANEYCLLGKW